MHGELNYLLASEQIADLRRAAGRERFVRFASHESVLTRVIVRVRRREHPIGHGATARLSDAQSTTGVTDAVAAEA